MKKTTLLVILDGWGHSADAKFNAVKRANTPNFDSFNKYYPNTLIHASGTKVGLSHKQMGNSEVGHLNIGAGRIVTQDLLKINEEISSKEFFNNKVLNEQLHYVKANDKALHIMGLLSDGGVHSHINHILALLKMVKNHAINKVYLHIFTDGRDTPPQSAINYITMLENCIAKINTVKISTVVGRYFAMDRDDNWDRTQQAFDLIAKGKATNSFDSATDCIKYWYDKNIYDEFIPPSVICGSTKAISEGDALIFMNYRADRARQLTEAFINKSFDNFSRGIFVPVKFSCLTQYKEEFNIPIAYAPTRLDNVLGEHLAKQKKTQLRIAETEKYAHVTFFFNGGIEKPFDGEDRVLIPSPSVKTYDLQPEMSAYELTNELIKNIKNKRYDLIVCNYANTDMVGHSGNCDATIKAVEVVDDCLGNVADAILSVSGAMLITADHGNAEKMWDKKTNSPHTAHTNNLVPLILISNDKNVEISNGCLADIAPTVINMMGLAQPKEMTGKNLIKCYDKKN